MEIRIKEKVYQYTSDFPDGWKFSRGDYFKFPVAIGPNNCFIKRFDKSTDNIAGWKLLEGLSEEYEPNLARVYFVAGDNENNATVNYVFFEYIEGKTLHDLVEKKVPFDFEKLTDGLFAALHTLETRAHWFPDFFEKNMFISRSGNFLLIDLDSAQPLKDLPHNDIWGCKDYWALVFKFCKDILQLTDIRPAYFYGSSFNYLHAVFLILRLKIFYLNDGAEYDDVAFFNQLPQHLNNISPSFKKIFNTVYQRRAHPLEEADIIAIKRLIHTEIIPLTSDGFNEVALNTGAALPAVAISSFEVINYMEQQAGIFVIASGETFKLKWDVQNAGEIELYQNGTFLQRFNGSQNAFDITEEGVDDQPKKIEYRLVARYDLDKVETALIVEIVPPFTNLAINDFFVNDYVEKNNEVYTVESGRDFTLQWNIRNAQKIELLKNGEQTRPFTNNETSVTLNEEAWDGKERIIEYTLVISHDEDSLESVEKTSLKVKLIYQQQDIEGFAVNSYLKKDGNEYIVESGKPFTLGWDLTQAREMEILKNGQPFKTVSANENNISITETVNDGNEKKIMYTLVSPATKSSNKSSRSVSVLVQKAAAGAPVIKVFKTNKSVIRGSGFFTLSWVVENASRLALYKNGMLYKEFQSNETSIELEESYEGSVKHLRFALHVVNDVELIRSETVNVDVKPKLNIIKIAAIFAALLAIAALIYFVGIPMLKHTGKSNMNTAGFKTVLHGDTVTFTGTNIPTDVSKVEVKFNDAKAKIVRLTKDSIQAEVPRLKANSDVNIIINIQGKGFTVAKHLPYEEKTVVDPPVFADFTEATLTQNEVVTIKGQNLPTDTGTIQVFIKQVPVKIIQQTADSIRILVPELKDKFVNITARMGGSDLLLAHDLLYLQSDVPFTETTINTISQRVLNEGDIITISGENIPKRRGDVKVKFNNTAVSTIRQTGKTIMVQVPSLSKDVSAVNITVSVNGRVYKAGSQIGYQPQQVVIFPTSQTKITEGENLFISGKNIPTDAGAVTVLFNNVRARITDQNSTLIKVVIPSLPLNTRQANVAVEINGKEQMVATNMLYQPLKAFVNVCDLAVLSPGTYKTGFLKLGNTHVELNLKNSSKYTMEEVIVTVKYIQKNGQEETEEFKFTNMAPDKSLKQRSKKDIKDATVKSEVTSVTTKDFGVQKCKR